MDFRLRPAEPSDLEFIWRLRVATMKHVIEAAYGWGAAKGHGLGRALVEYCQRQARQAGK